MSPSHSGLPCGQGHRHGPVAAQEGPEDYLDSIGDWSLSIVTAMELAAGAKNNDEIREIDI